MNKFLEKYTLPKMIQEMKILTTSTNINFINN